ncbi:sensor histidine kinase [Bradyrhizobium liaoningense]|uniref:sensor histidine kinase n=1 Tax=Bradyrhizobium liaoningense TaxID=43992 RepID=UPI001BAD805D|nr:ATP-binding protein [Bradyrhizobium liaoningense]MBR0823596.1 ATP-binding protein [Bradyrhizobium liaoningense]
MQIEEAIVVSFPGFVESPPLEDVVVLADGAGVTLGVQRALSATVQGVRDGGSSLIASKCVEISLVGSSGEVSGVVRHTCVRSDRRHAVAPRRRERVSAIADVAPFVVCDINNNLAVIGSGRRLLECQDDAAYGKAIVGKMQEAITRAALLARQVLDAARPGSKSIDGLIEGSRLAATEGSLDRVLRPDITVHAEIAPDLWSFNADPEELYFALLGLCRNSADAMPDGGAITIAARNVESLAGAAREFIEIIVADDGEGLLEEVLSRAFTPYFTTKAPGSGTGLGLSQVERFAEGRGGAVFIESERGAGTLVRLLLPRAHAVEVPSSIEGTEIAYPAASNGSEFHVVNPVAATPTS